MQDVHSQRHAARATHSSRSRIGARFENSLPQTHTERETRRKARKGKRRKRLKAKGKPPESNWSSFPFYPFSFVLPFRLSTWPCTSVVNPVFEIGSKSFAAVFSQTFIVDIWPCTAFDRWRIEPESGDHSCGCPCISGIPRRKL